jgi:hypothetical protein
MTVTGKIQKFKMREQSIAELGLDATVRTAWRRLWSGARRVVNHP